MTSNTVVTYRNNGNFSVSNATVTVSYPKYIVPVSSYPVWKTKTDSTLVYNLKDFAADSAGSIMIKDSVICGNESIRGLTQCIWVYISPISDCKSVVGKYQNDIKVSSSCVNGQAWFTIENNGQAQTDSLGYRLYRNDSLWISAKYLLGEKGNIRLAVPAKGNSFRLEA